MKKHIYKAFAKKLFGARYERLGKTVFTEIILFYSLHITGLQVRIAPSVLYLMTTVFTAGIMWQALSSSDHAGQLKHMLMLPFVGKEFIWLCGDAGHLYAHYENYNALVCCVCCL